MVRKRLGNWLLIAANLGFVILICCGCSSVIRDKAVRNERLAGFLNQSVRLALYFPARLHSEENLTVFGLEGVGERLQQQLGLPDPTPGVLSRFISATPALADSSVRIIPPAEVSSLRAERNEMVLFFNSDWRMSYRRLPPNFNMNQLQVGIIAKVIPLGQVREGKGTLALPTAAWEGTCVYEPYDGAFVHVDDWEKDNGTMLRDAIAAVQEYCGRKLAAEFMTSLGSS